MLNEITLVITNFYLSSISIQCYNFNIELTNFLCENLFIVLDSTKITKKIIRKFSPFFLLSEVFIFIFKAIWNSSKGECTITSKHTWVAYESCSVSEKANSIISMIIYWLEIREFCYIFLHFTQREILSGSWSQNDWLRLLTLFEIFSRLFGCQWNRS